MDFVDTHLRQMDIINPDQLQFDISVIGAGAIGSFTALALAKMGCSNITVWDDDTVEEHNIGNQLSGIASIGDHKTASINTIIENLCGLILNEERRKYQGQKIKPGVVIVGCDNMITRKKAFERVVRKKSGVDFFIDGRMGAEFMRIYSFNTSNEELCRAYAKTLYTYEEAEDLPCSGRSVIYCPFVIAGIICSTVKKFARQEPTAFEILFDMSQNIFFHRSK